MVDVAKHDVQHIGLPKTPMADLGTIKCAGMHPGDITEEIIARVTQKHLPLYAMAQVTLDGLSREHGKGIDMKDLAGVRENLLDLKIHRKDQDSESPVPLQQDIRMIDYLQEFGEFIGKQQLNVRQKAFVVAHGKEILAKVMDEHRETAE
jgi:DNA repair protein SbcD/Mre11